MTSTMTAKTLAAGLNLTPAAALPKVTPSSLSTSAPTTTGGIATLLLTPPPANAKNLLNMSTALAQNSPSSSPSSAGSLIDAFNSAVEAAKSASNGDRAGAIKNAQKATDNAAAGTQGVLNGTKAATQGTPLESLGKVLHDIGTPATDLGKTLTGLAIDIADIGWSNNPTKNLQTIKNIHQLLSTASTSTLPEIDRQMKDISSSDPAKFIGAAKKLGEGLGQIVSLYDTAIKTSGFDPASIDPNIGKFMDRLRDTSKDLGNFINNYSEYHKKAQGLPQMGTMADVGDYFKARLSFDSTHAMKRIARNQAAGAALEDWSKVKKNFNSLITLEDFK